MRCIAPASSYICVSHDRPNEHAQQYPTLISGNLNATTLIVPITLETAREIIPKEYGIIEHAYRALLPSFPQGMYPMMAQIAHDHDIQLPAYNASLPDFTRASFEFPFVDTFGDGQASFRWAGTSMISAHNQHAIEGASSYYGMQIHPAVFDPPCNAYRATPDGSTFVHSKGTSANGTQSKFMTLETRPSWDEIPYPLEFLENITNQPVFARTQACDYYTRLFNTSLTTGENAPVPVKGDVEANLEPFRTANSWMGVYGWRIATPFLEPPVPEECKRP
ncbi:hypothetical protein F4779DRAFT_618042 [Xylariaceae sp. FL0662B]|nr:hypothetical protein F4779DRAFT_618042 [Xylariaceae sp. FL0662B]